MQVHFCGVRGSKPSPGPDFVRYGGNTSSVAIAADGAQPNLVVDAGTGITRVTRLLDNGVFDGALLLGHLHWDHTQGLPFFPGGDNPVSRVDLYMPAQGDPVAVLARAMSPPHFPIEPTELRGEWSFHALEPGIWDIAGYRVLAQDIPHKGGRSFGYRISDGLSTVTYMSDHSPINLGEGPEGWGEYHDAAIELARDADLLIHDAQYTPEEFERRKAWGHSTMQYPIRLAELANVGEVALFHHDPSHTDDFLDAIATEVATDGVFLATEDTVTKI